MCEKKKFMPSITNYLSDIDDDVEDSVDSNSNPPPVHNNYAEWKRLQKGATNSQNGSRSLQAPLGDISSCEEDSKFDDNEPIFKIMACLADKEAFRKRNESLRKKHKKPSHYLLFSRMKQLKHFDCSFSDLCQITQASWENMQPIENEELMGNIDLRIREYGDVLSKFRSMLLPDSSGHLKNNSWVSAAVASKHESQHSRDSPPTNDAITNPKLPTTIPERLQNLAGNASVYNAPEKIKRTVNHTFTSYKARNLYNSDTSLNYVNAINSNQNCNFPDCENKPIDDYRWDGQYCSAKCLIKDCHLAFQGWLSDQRELTLTNGSVPAVVDNEDEEIMLYLASPSRESSGSNSKDDSLFESLQKDGESKVVEIVKKNRKLKTTTLPCNFDTDLVAASRLHSLINRATEREGSIQSDDYEDFRDCAKASL